MVLYVGRALRTNLGSETMIKTSYSASWKEVPSCRLRPCQASIPCKLSREPSLVPVPDPQLSIVLYNLHNDPNSSEYQLNPQRPQAARHHALAIPARLSWPSAYSLSRSLRRPLQGSLWRGKLERHPRGGQKGSHHISNRDLFPDAGTGPQAAICAGAECGRRFRPGRSGIQE